MPISDKSSDVEPSSENKPGFLKHALLYGMGSVSLQLISILIVPLYAWKLSVAEYGALQLLYRVGDLINMVLMVNGTRMAALAFWGKADSEADRRRLVPSITWLNGLVLIAGGVLILASARIVSPWLGIGDWRLFACGVYATMLQGATVVPLTFMQARLESRSFAVTSTIIAFSQLCLITVALCVLGLGIWGVVLAYGLNSIVFGVWLNWRELARSGVFPDKSQMRAVVRFALPFIPSGMCYFMLHNGDQLFLVKYHNAHVLGVYALAYRLTSGVAMFASQPLCQVWNASMYNAYRDVDRSAIFGRAITRITASLVFTSLAVTIFRHEVLFLLNATKFAGAAEVLPILLLAYVFLVLSNLADGAIYVTGRTELKPLIAAFSTVVMVVAYWFLIPRYAAMGAATATLLGFMTLFAATVTATRKHFAIEFEWRRLTALVAFALVIGAISEYLAGIWPLIPLRLGLLVTFPAVLWFVGLVHPAEKEYVRKLAHTWLSRCRTATASLRWSRGI